MMMLPTRPASPPATRARVPRRAVLHAHLCHFRTSSFGSGGLNASLMLLMMPMKCPPVPSRTRASSLKVDQGPGALERARGERRDAARGVRGGSLSDMSEARQAFGPWARGPVFLHFGRPSLVPKRLARRESLRLRNSFDYRASLRSADPSARSRDPAASPWRGETWSDCRCGPRSLEIRRGARAARLVTVLGRRRAF